MNDVPFSDGYHIYDINWTPTSITWSIDRKTYFTANKSDFGYSTWPFGPMADGSAPRMFLILNLAMGGDMGGAISNGLQATSMTVDWVRYYKINGVGAVTTK
jgi:beta-glucanase (GH16 family)